MNKPKMTFAEGLKLSWQREWQIGDPWRIARLAFSTVYYGAIHVFLFVLPSKMIELGRWLTE